MAIVILFLMADVIARRLPRSAPWEFEVRPILLFLLMLYAADPYSSGRVGGHANLQPVYSWQQWTTALLCGLLVLTGIALHHHARLIAVLLLSAEGVSFLILNAWYLFRDGFGFRFYSGYDDRPLPLLIFLAGCAGRILIASTQ